MLHDVQARRAGADLAAARHSSAQLESSLRAKEREVDKAVKAMEALKAECNAAEARVTAAESGVTALESEAASLRARMVAAEGAVKSGSREAEKLAKQVRREEPRWEVTQADSCCCYISVPLFRLGCYFCLPRSVN